MLWNPVIPSLYDLPSYSYMMRALLSSFTQVCSLYGQLASYMIQLNLSDMTRIKSELLDNLGHLGLICKIYVLDLDVTQNL